MQSEEREREMSEMQWVRRTERHSDERNWDGDAVRVREQN